MNDLLESLRLHPDSSMADQIYRHFKDAILEERLRPGEQLPGEIALSAALGVGRTTLREALRGLETLQLIRRTRQGTFVNDMGDYLQSLPMEEMFAHSKRRDILEVRQILEVHGAGLAARRATPDNLRRMEGCIDKMRRHSADIGKATHYDAQFHMEIATAAQNQVLLQAIEAMRGELFGYIAQSFSLSPAMLEQALAFHRSLLQALTRGDAAAAREIMGHHLESTVHMQCDIL